MEKYTTQQLQDALIGLHPKKDAASTEAFEMTFDEVAKRMGDVEFDAWCEKQGF